MTEFKIGQAVRIIKPQWGFDKVGDIGVIIPCPNHPTVLNIDVPEHPYCTESGLPEGGEDERGWSYARTDVEPVEQRPIGDGFPPDESPQPDAVNHPTHYTSHPSGVECIEVVEEMNFCTGNAIKYLWRAGLKNDALEDLKKARFYVNREISRLERK